MNLSRVHFNLRYILQLGVFSGIYIFTARLGLSFDAVSGFATLIWPPTAIALVAVFLYGYRLWPAIFLSAFLVNFWEGAPALVALGMGTGNTLEAIVGVYLAHRFGYVVQPFAQQRGILKFILFTAGIATLVSATIGSVSLWLGHVIPAQDFTRTWLAWWLGDLMSVLIVFPVAFLWLSRRRSVVSPSLLEGVSLLLFLVGVNILVFWSPATMLQGGSLLYFVFLPLIWSALRFGIYGTAITIFVTASIAITSTVLNNGPFATSVLNEGLAYLHLFLGVTSATFLIFAAVVEEREVNRQENIHLLDESKKTIGMRDMFISIASHELKTPITSLKLRAQLLQKQVNESAAVKNLSGALLKMDQQITKITLLVERLLDVSKIQLGKLELQPEEFDMHDLVQEIIYDIQSTAEKHTIILEGTIVKKIWGDKERIGQVLMNLLTNAIRYSPDADRVRVALIEEANAAIVIVEDWGIGIEAQHQDKIFQRFYRVDHTGSNLSGLGIGLYISSEIMERHQGSIEVASILGKGSIFKINIPFQPKGSAIR